MLATENVKYASLIAIAIAVFVSLAIAAVGALYIYQVMYKEENQKILYLAGAGGIVFVAAVVFFIVIYYVAMVILEPGNTAVEVKNADEVLPKVAMTRVTMLGLFSALLMKVFGKKTEEKQAVASNTVTIQSEADEIVNSLN